MISSSAKRREEEAGTVSPAVIRKALRQVSRQAGCEPKKLLMVDYQASRHTDCGLPSVEQILARYGSWKSARRDA